MKTHRYVLSLFVGLLGMACSCATTQTVQLERDVDQLKTKLEALEQSNASLQRSLEEVQAQNAEILQKLQSARPERTDSTSEPSPGFRDRYEIDGTPSTPAAPWREPLAQQTPPGEDELQLNSGEPDRGPAMASQDPTELYSQAFGHLKEGRFHKAILLFNVFVERFPQHDLTDNAYYWIGECWYGLRNYPRSIAAFDLVLSKFPNGNKVPDALLKKAFSLQKVGRDQEALDELRRVQRQYPSSPSAQKAQAKIQEIMSSNS